MLKHTFIGFFLIQPKWLPERMIMSDPRKWMKNCLDKWSGNHKFGKVEEGYLKCFKQPKEFMDHVKIIELLQQLTWIMIKKTEKKTKYSYSSIVGKKGCNW